VLLVILTQGSVYLLAVGYLVGGILGFVTYGALLRHVLRSKGLWAHFDLRRIVMPFREIFSFSTPLLTSDAVTVFRGSLVVVMLERLASTTAVAEFQAVWPIARLNLFVMQSFKYLFTPLAARLFAREDAAGINDLYWQTATWIALFTFPVFAVSFSLARPLTVLLFGSRYADSGIILTILAFGNYFNAALGFNAYTLRVYGKVAYIMAIDVLSLLIGLALNLWLIPLYGALGAAVATTVSLVIYNVLNHGGLLLGTHIKLFQARYLGVYASLILATAGLYALQQLLNPPFFIGVAAAAAVSLLMIRLNRTTMNVAQMFPEVMRLPLAGRLFA
jgi:O-antigen/teichoic acid export membrane protein